MNKYHFILLALFLSPLSSAAENTVVSTGSAAKEKTPELTAPALAESMAYEKSWNEKHPAAEYVSYLKSSLKTPVRSPANDENVTAPKDLTQLRTDLYGLANADALSAYIQNTVIPNYKTYSPDTQLVANQLIEFSVLRGFIFKMVPLVDQQKMAHSFLLTFVMRLATSLSIYFPDYNQWKVGFNFLVEPYEGIHQFTQVRDLQAFLNTTLYQAINDSDLRLRQIPISEKGLVWDNTFLMNSTSYADAFDRFVFVQEAERYAWLAGKQRAMARMKTFCAYDLDDSFAIMNNIAKMQTEEAVEGLILDRANGQSSVEGLSSKDRNNKINDAHYPKFGNIWSGGFKMMPVALQHYQMMVRDLSTSWGFLDNKKTEYNHVFIQRGYAEVFDRRIGQVLPTWKDLLGLSAKGDLPDANLQSHPVSLTSHLEGSAKNPEKVTVDLVAFFHSPPKKLRALLPVSYEANDRKAEWKTKGTFKYHNYTRGMATEWNYQPYSTLFPDLAKNATAKGDKIKKFQKIMSESWGGRFIGMPLAAFLY
jgi:hypothetical protein